MRSAKPFKVPKGSAYPMLEVLKALNHLVLTGVIETYAIGGAIGAAFYIEASQTEDVDAFIILPSSNSPLVSLSPVYDALKTQGGVVDREYVRFGLWPLQILTDSNPLVEEAIRMAVSVDFEQVPTRVFRAEHLCAIALQTGRAKDYARVSAFLEQAAVDASALQSLARRFSLETALTKVLQ